MLISIDFDDFTSPFLLSFCLRRCIKHSRQCFIGYPNTSNFVSLFSVSGCNISNTSDSVSSGYPNTEKRVENTTRSGVFLTKFEVFG